MFKGDGSIPKLKDEFPTCGLGHSGIDQFSKKAQIFIQFESLWIESTTPKCSPSPEKAQLVSVRCLFLFFANIFHSKCPLAHTLTLEILLLCLSEIITFIVIVTFFTLGNVQFSYKPHILSTFCKKKKKTESGKYIFSSFAGICIVVALTVAFVSKKIGWGHVMFCCSARACASLSFPLLFSS